MVTPIVVASTIMMPPMVTQFGRLFENYANPVLPFIFFSFSGGE
jgi:hypothetical protein